MNFDELIKHKCSDFEPQAFSSENEILQSYDSKYLDFIRNFNGGYFYNNSLHIFGYTKKVPYHDLNYINKLFQMLFGELCKNMWFFAEDIFGNPFGFYKDEIILFNLETSEKENVANDFEDWLHKIENETDYLTGESLANELSVEDKFKLAFGKRLGAKYPFVLGGEYSMSNLVLKNFEDNLAYNASIAKQIVNLPNGSNIKLNIIK